MAAISKRDPAADAERRRAQELRHLQSQNAQLKVVARRHQLMLRAQRNAPAARLVSVPPPPYQPVDPRRVPVAGTKVLPPLSPPLSLGIRMGAAIGAELRAMAIETRALIRRLAKLPDTSAAMDAAPGEHEFELLRAKWAARFTALARTWSYRLVTDVTAQSTAQMAHGLKDVASLQQIESTMQTPRMRAIVAAASEASTGLITRIPQRFLGDVQTQVMSAITTGSGLDKLVPYLTKRYKGDARHAHLVALDQIRKVSSSVNGARLMALGVKSFIWIHVGGERYPRELHQKYSGKEFDYSNPPLIDKDTDQYGLPGQAINCRCVARPVLRFAEMSHGG